MNRNNILKMAILFGMAVFILNCSPKKILLNQFDGVFESVESVYLTDDDPELVRESFPFNLKIIEILLDQNPKDRDMLLMAMSSFTMYSFGFIMEDADRVSQDNYKQGTVIYNRANNLFARALKYGMKGLELKYPNINNLLNERPEGNPFEAEDVPYLYWLSATYGGLISSSQGSPQYVVDLPNVGWLLDKCLDLDPEWSDGAIYSAMISYTMSRPDAYVNREKIARSYFEKAAKASNNLDCSIYVTLAESVCVKNQYKDEFNNLLNFVIKFDLENAPNKKLTNSLAKFRAQWLLDRTDELFY